MTETSTWICQIQYYKNGIEHIPFIDFFYSHSDEGSDERNEFVMDVMFKHHILDAYKDPVSYCPAPRESVEGYIYDGVRIKRTPETEEEFDTLERSFHTYKPGWVKEIWRFSIHQWWRGVKTYTQNPDGSVTVVKSELVSQV